MYIMFIKNTRIYIKYMSYVTFANERAKKRDENSKINRWKQ